MIVSLVDARGTGGVRIWSDRVEAMLGRDRFRTLLVGPGAPRDGAAWNDGDDPADIVLRLADALDGATTILPNGTAHGYAAAALHPGARTLAIAHGRDHTWQEIADACHGLPLAWACVSRSVRSVLEPWVGRDAPVIPCGVPMPAHAGLCAWDGARALRLLSLGRIEQRHKRTLDLADLCAHLDRAGIAYELTIAGDGPDATALAERLGTHDRVRLLGQVDAARAHELRQWCDLLVLPSAAEGNPLTAMEAMADGRPVLATTTSGGAAEAIEASYCGWLAPLGDTALMARIIGSLTPDMLHLAGARARAHAEHHFDLARTTVAMLERALPLAGDPARIFAGLCRAAGIVEASAALRRRFAESWRVSADALPARVEHRPTIRERLMARALDGLTGTAAVYGAGVHTRSLAGWIAQQPRIACIFDDRAVPGQTLAGKPVVKPGGIDVDGVIVSSDAHEQAMLAKLASVLPGVCAMGLYGMDNERLMEPWLSASAGSCVLAA